MPRIPCLFSFSAVNQHHQPLSTHHLRPKWSAFLPPKLPSQLKTLQADKLRAQQQLEQLQARYVGTGHADTTRYEWTSNVARDSLASYVGHAPLLQYMSLGMAEPREKVRAMLIDVRLLSFLDG
jgi:splicing factor 3B subunit 5